MRNWPPSTPTPTNSGLLALRLIAGDHDTKNPQHLPPTTPGLLRQIITDTLTNQPHNAHCPKPGPTSWATPSNKPNTTKAHRGTRPHLSAPHWSHHRHPSCTPDHRQTRARSQPPTPTPYSNRRSVPLTTGAITPSPSKSNLGLVVGLAAAVAVVVVLAVALVAVVNQQPQRQLGIQRRDNHERVL